MKKLTLSSLKASDLAANFRKTNLNDNKLIIRITKKLKEYNEIYFTGYITRWWGWVWVIVWTKRHICKLE